MEAIRKIEEAYPKVRKNGNVIWLPLDLTYPADVIRSAKDFMAREERLDVLRRLLGNDTPFMVAGD